MKIRWAIQRQVYRLQKVAAPVSLLLLILNLALTLTGLIAWRGLHPYAIVALSVTVLAVLVLGFANFYVLVLRMHVAERRAIVDHDPVQVYAFLPFQAALTLNNQVPMMRALAKQTGDEELSRAADRVEKWAKGGFIPRDEYPPELAHYYRTGGGRL